MASAGRPGPRAAAAARGSAAVEFVMPVSLGIPAPAGRPRGPGAGTNFPRHCGTQRQPTETD